MKTFKVEAYWRTELKGKIELCLDAEDPGQVYKIVNDKCLELINTSTGEISYTPGFYDVTIVSEVENEK